ncbi:MAG: 2,3-diphosphoglycerate-dependent phosphoglycerate mutase [Candidatus Bruticola sp.]
MMKLVMVRHGQSMWNLENRFTGWTDVDLSENGIKEAEEAGHLLKANGFSFDMAFTSVLRRANHTLELILKELGESNIPIKYTWRLNERHYGALQGLNKDETRAKYGAEQVHIWRRSADVRPPALDKDDERYPGNDPKYKDLTPEQLPLTEHLLDTVDRVVPYWDSDIKPALLAGKKCIIAAHGNSIRALVKYIENIGTKEIMDVEIPTGKPLVYELDDKTLAFVKKYYL